MKKLIFVSVIFFQYNISISQNFVKNDEFIQVSLELTSVGIDSTLFLINISNISSEPLYIYEGKQSLISSPLISDSIVYIDLTTKFIHNPLHHPKYKLTFKKLEPKKTYSLKILREKKHANLKSVAFELEYIAISKIQNKRLKKRISNMLKKHRYVYLKYFHKYDKVNKTEFYIHFNPQPESILKQSQ